MYPPITSDMRKPREYRKATILAGILVGAMYLTFLPGHLYGLALLGLVIGVSIYQHIAAKLIFVHIVRGSRHLQSGTLTHWAIWLGPNLLLSVLGSIIAEGSTNPKLPAECRKRQHTWNMS